MFGSKYGSRAAITQSGHAFGKKNVTKNAANLLSTVQNDAWWQRRSNFGRSWRRIS